MLNPSYNGTGKHDLVAKQTVSGLWRICHTDRKCFLLCLFLPSIEGFEMGKIKSCNTQNIFVITKNTLVITFRLVTFKNVMTKIYSYLD